MHVCWCEEAAPSARVQPTMRACVRKVAGTSCESRMGDPVMEASGWLVKVGGHRACMLSAVTRPAGRGVGCRPCRPLAVAALCAHVAR